MEHNRIKITLTLRKQRSRLRRIFIMASSHLSPHPTEATPLLVETHGDSEIADQLSDRQDEGEPTTEPAGPGRDHPPSRVNRVIYFMSWVMAALSFSQVVFLGILFAMNSYGSSHFGDSDWTFHYDGASYAFLVCYLPEKPWAWPKLTQRVTRESSSPCSVHSTRSGSRPGGKLPRRFLVFSFMGPTPSSCSSLLGIRYLVESTGAVSVVVNHSMTRKAGTLAHMPNVWTGKRNTSLPSGSF